MALYSNSGRTTNTANNSANFELRASNSRPLKIVEVGVFLAAATASTIGIGRPAARGINPPGSAFLLGEDNETNSLASVAINWATGPTVPAGGNFFRRISLPATVGVGVIWTFPTGLFVPIDGSVVIWNLSTVGVMDAYIKIDE